VNHPGIQVPAWTGPADADDELSHSSDFECRHRLHSESSLCLIVRPKRLSTYGDRALPVTGPRPWKSLPPHVKSVLSVNIFKTRLTTFLFYRSFLSLFTLIVKCLCSAFCIYDTIIVRRYYYYYVLQHTGFK